MFTLHEIGMKLFAVIFVVGFCAYIIYACARSAKEEWKEGGKTPSSLGKILVWVFFIIIFGIGLVAGLSTCTTI